MIAKVVFPLPINTPLDYYVPGELSQLARRGVRVKVPFRNTFSIGYVVDMVSKSPIKNIKPVIAVLDQQPILDDSSFALSQYISLNCLCSQGEAIDIILPSLLRKGRKIEAVSSIKYQVSGLKPKSGVVLLHDLAGRKWPILKEKIFEAIRGNKGIIILSPEINSVLRIKRMIEDEFKAGVSLLHSKTGEKEELGEWLKLKNGVTRIAVGTSFAVFAPVMDLGLIIIDEEEARVYKQEQSPYYNAKDIALYRAKFTQAELILVSSVPSLESYYLAKKGKYALIGAKENTKPRITVQVADESFERHKQKKTQIILSGILESGIRSALACGGKVILFLNRVGFATAAVCSNCGFVLKCGRCSRNLVFMFEKKELLCRSCNFKIALPKVCPKCGLDYIRYFGMGTEKLESEAHRLFTGARIIRHDKPSASIAANFRQFDIIITTQIIEKDLDELGGFDLLGVLSFDALLNRMDFRAAEKAFGILWRLVSVVKAKAIIQTHLLAHHIIKALRDNDQDYFYRQELRERKELGLPPFTYLALINLRGKNEDNLVKAASGIFENLRNRASLLKGKLEVFEPMAGIPLRLRGNFRYNMLLKSKSHAQLIKFLQSNMGVFKKSGIIITVDINPL